MLSFRLGPRDWEKFMASDYKYFISCSGNKTYLHGKQLVDTIAMEFVGVLERSVSKKI